MSGKLRNVNLVNINSTTPLFFLLFFFQAALSDVKNKHSWIPVNDINLEIVKDSVLDFSNLVEVGPAGKQGAIVSGNNGYLAFAQTADQPQRFMCASQPYGVEEGFPDHKTADRYARQLRMHGYNLARFHFLENVLMHGKNKDFDFDPEQLDRLHYFMAALKKEGIYWMMDALTSWNGAYGDVGKSRWAKKRNVKLGLYYDKKDRKHWKKLVTQLLTVENPYTKLAPLKDPALMGIVLVNEGGLNPLIDQQSSEEMNQLFRSWLNRRYGANATKSKYWKLVKPELPRKQWTVTSGMKDVQRFYFELQSETLSWMTLFFRDLGYQGLLSSYNNWFHLQDIAIRSQLEWVDLHSYHDLPHQFVAKGSSIKQASSLPDGVKYIREMAVSRYWGKPLTVSEYDQPFWNKWRFESGLAMGAYASLQDWDLICRHTSGPIELAYGAKKSSRGQAIYPFASGLDPVARASETLATLLFLRKDVKASRHRVALNINTDYALEKQGGIGKFSDNISKLGLITGLGLIWNDNKETKKITQISKKVTPDNSAQTLSNKVLEKFNNWVGLSDIKWEKRLDKLRQQGILSQDNKSDRDRFHSDTGEILLDTKFGFLQVVTDKTEAVAISKIQSHKLSNLEIISASQPALISISAMDGNQISESKRMLLIIATDARNTGMKFLDSDEKILDRLGHLPINIKTGRFSLQIKSRYFERLKLYALGLNGERKSEINMSRKQGKVKAEIALDKLPQGVTTFFELMVETDR